MIIKNWYPVIFQQMLCRNEHENKVKLMHTPQLRQAGLMVLLAGLLLPMIDFSIVNVALDAMAHSLQATPTQLALIVAVYGITFAVCLAMGGRLGDNYGRRRVFISGVGIFALASLLCGMASGAGMLMFARALQGVGAALIVPQILATLHITLQGREHARAIGLYGGMGGLAFVIGQVLGGFLIKADPGGYGWRSVFLINLPICLGVLVAARRFIPETRNATRVPVDISGALLLGGATGALLLSLALGPVLNWRWPCVLLLLLAPLFLLQLRRVSVRAEASGHSPLLPPSLLRLPGVRFSLTLAVIFFSCWSGFMFVMALTLQSGLGFSAFDSGNAFIALGVAYFIGAMRSTALVTRFGTRTMLLAGWLCYSDHRPAGSDGNPAAPVAAGGYSCAGASHGTHWIWSVFYCQYLLPYWHARYSASSGGRRQRHVVDRAAVGDGAGADAAGRRILPFQPDRILAECYQRYAGD